MQRQNHRHHKVLRDRQQQTLNAIKQFQRTEGKRYAPIKDSTSGEPAYPKGIAPLTLKKIRAVFERPHPEGFSAEEVGQQTGVSRTTARRTLEDLTAGGQLNAELIYGAVGRPERKYFAGPIDFTYQPVPCPRHRLSPIRMQSTGSRSLISRREIQECHWEAPASARPFPVQPGSPRQ